MVKVGITGGIGSGKSTVCRVLEVLGYPVFYSDSEAKKILEADPVVVKGVKALFGEESYVEGKYVPSHVAPQLFSDRELRDKMNAIVHPAVYRAFDAWAEQQHSELVFNESALLYETGSYRRFDRHVLVFCELEERIRRVQARDQSSREQVLHRIASQIDVEQAKSYANFVLDNSGTILLTPQIVEMTVELTKV